MEFGVFKISESLIVLTMAGAIGWIILRVLFLPRAHAWLKEARDHKIPLAAAHLALVKSLSSLAITLLVCPILVAVVCAYAQWRIEVGPQDTAKIQSVVQTRAWLESIVHPITNVSLHLWLIGVIALAAIWVIASTTASRRSWSHALSARRSAHLASISSKSDAELQAEASQLDLSAVQRVLTAASRVEEQNRKGIKSIETAPLFTVEGADKQKRQISITELRGIAADLEARAAKLENPAADFRTGPRSDAPPSAA